jgi:hypothetical protein
MDRSLVEFPNIVCRLCETKFPFFSQAVLGGIAGIQMAELYPDDFYKHTAVFDLKLLTTKNTFTASREWSLN